MAVTYEDILNLFQETDRKFQETERLLKESSSDTDRKMQETDRLVKKLSKNPWAIWAID